MVPLCTPDADGLPLKLAETLTVTLGVDDEQDDTDAVPLRLSLPLGDGVALAHDDVDTVPVADTHALGVDVDETDADTDGLPLTLTVPVVHPLDDRDGD